MSQALAPTTWADSNPDGVNHTAIEMEVASDYQADDSDRFYILYNEMASKLDSVLLNTYAEHGRDLMVLSGLVSAAIAVFLSQSYITSLPTSQDVSAFYLTRLFNLELLQANLTNSNLTSQGLDLSTSGIPSPTSAPHATHILWFFSLGTSLTSALLSTMLQSWVRRYMVMTQPPHSPHIRALICAQMRQQQSLASLQLAIDSLHLLLDISIFTFLSGLYVLIIITSQDAGSLVIVGLISAPLLFWYMIISQRSYHRHTIYSTPLSRVTRHVLAFLEAPSPPSRHLLRRLWNSLWVSLPIPFPLPWHNINAFLSFDWVALDRLDTVAGILAETQSYHLLLHEHMVDWLLRSLNDDQDLERFLDSISTFYNSKVVKEPRLVFQPFHKDRMPRMILSFMRRTLSSAALPDDVKQRRIGLCLEVIEQDPYLLERTLAHLSLPVASTIMFQCAIDWALVVDQFTGKVKTQFPAKCLRAVAINHFVLGELRIDERWFNLVGSWLSSPISTSHDISDSDGQLASMKLDNLVRLARILQSSDLPDVENKERTFSYALQAASNFPVENITSESRNKFCGLWNEFQNATLGDAPGNTNASLILPYLRNVYSVLHGGTIINASPLTAYPRCTEPTHLPNP